MTLKWIVNKDDELEREDEAFDLHLVSTVNRFMFSRCVYLSFEVGTYINICKWKMIVCRFFTFLKFASLLKYHLNNTIKRLSTHTSFIPFLFKKII